MNRSAMDETASLSNPRARHPGRVRFRLPARPRRWREPHARAIAGRPSVSHASCRPSRTMRHPCGLPSAGWPGSPRMRDAETVSRGAEAPGFSDCDKDGNEPQICRHWLSALTSDVSIHKLFERFVTPILHTIHNGGNDYGIPEQLSTSDVPGLRISPLSLAP